MTLEFDVNKLRPLFLGPKAENSELFEQLLVQCFRDHCYWRRNFHPEDREWVNEADRLTPEFAATHASLRDGLNRLLADLKRSAPTFHPRYQGHMHTDLLMAGILGEFAAVFYSQNNVVAEGSPVTARIELKAVEKVASMVGYATTAGTAAWGHICSGGTVANIQAIWTARNVRQTPVSLYLTIKKLQRECDDWPDDLIEVLSEFSVCCGGDDRRLLELSTKELLSVPVNEILAFRGRLTVLLEEVRRTCQFDPIVGGAAITSRMLADVWLREYSPAERGAVAIDRELVKCNLDPVSDYSWSLLVSSTKHYSIEKIADLVGLGRKCLTLIPIDRDFSVDTSLLQEALDHTIHGDEGILPLCVIAVMGSTEEGAVDDLPTIVQLREQYRQKGGEFWIHADGAYGGYAAAMLRSGEGVEEAYSAPTYFTALAGRDLGENEQVAVWSRSLHRLAGLCEADSVTIDPHKMGLLPYPAGVILFKDAMARNAVSCDAPYLFDGEEVDQFPGQYTLEGSRPGHVAAGVYLSHQVLPLDQFGHGAIVGRSMLAADEIYTELPRLMNQEKASPVSIQFLARPALNILNYAVCHRDVRTLHEQNILTDLILREFSADAVHARPIPDFGFFLVATSLPLSKYRRVLEPFFEQICLTVDGSEWVAASLRVVRSVIMHPHLLGAETRIDGKSIRLVDELARELVVACEESFSRIEVERYRLLHSSFKRPPRILIVENERDHLDLIKSILLKRLDPHEPLVATDCKSAIETIQAERKSGRPIDLLLADLNLDGDQGVAASTASGMDVVRQFRETFVHSPVLVTSVFSGITREERDLIAADVLFDKTDFGDGAEFARSAIELLEMSVASKGDRVQLPPGN